MPLHEYDELDATGLAALVRAGDVTPAELLAAAIDRIEARNPALNAVVRPMYDQARQAIERGLPDGPMRGVPMVLKDLMADYAGMPTSSGCRLLARYVPSEDAEIVARWKRAGLVMVGKSNTPELGIIGVTEPALWGATRNPWNREHTTGGSSGGSAAAVASRMVPIGGAGDGGGSIRIPASCCGLVGLKPTRGRTPNGPSFVGGWSTMTVQHVLARSMRDTAALLDIAAGPELGAPFDVVLPERPYVDELARAPGKLRVAFFTGTFFAADNHPSGVAAVERTAALLASLGHEVEEATPAIDRDALVRAWMSLVAANIAQEVAWAERVAGRRAARDDIELLTRLTATLGRHLRGDQIIEHELTMMTQGHVVARFFERYDVLVTSTLGRPPARIGEFALPPVQQLLARIAIALPTRMAMAKSLDMMCDDPQLRAYPNTQLANLTGQPGLSLPLAST
ncbi:MAG: amidase, partial [Deltaproteobacteria bacterium]|nr:amidase [Nannocystaceae bacterium]